MTDLSQPTLPPTVPASGVTKTNPPGATRRDLLLGGSATAASALLGALGLSACGGGGDAGTTAEGALSSDVGGVDGRKAALAITYADPAHTPNIYDSNDVLVGTVAPQVKSSNSNGPFTRIGEPQFNRPLPTVARPETTVPCGAFWYQDFGLEHTRDQLSKGNYGVGWIGWYDWRWNHTVDRGENGHGVPLPYKADRHPMLGWYRGDNLNVLGWQVKWLVEHGVRFTVCQQRAAQPDDGGNWNQPGSVAHWIYQLMKGNGMRNVGENGLQLAFWLPNTGEGSLAAYKATRGYWLWGTAYAAGDTVINDDGFQYRALQPIAGGNTSNPRPNAAADTVYWAKCHVPAAWKTFADFYLNPNHRSKIYCVTRPDGKRYPLVYFHQGEVSRDAWGTNALALWLKELARHFKDSNPAWSGMAVLMRNSPPPSRLFGTRYDGGLLDYDDLEAGGVLLLRGDYNGLSTSAGAAGSYEQIINKVGNYEPGNRGERALPRRVFTAVTSLETHPGHDSHYAFPGHSPASFRRLLTSIVPFAKPGGDAFPLMMVNNVSEWAESGPGLQPNKQDGFGYLKALKDALAPR